MARKGIEDSGDRPARRERTPEETAALRLAQQRLNKGHELNQLDEARTYRQIQLLAMQLRVQIADVVAAINTGDQRVIFDAQHIKTGL